LALRPGRSWTRGVSRARRSPRVRRRARDGAARPPPPSARSRRGDRPPRVLDRLASLSARPGRDRGGGGGGATRGRRGPHPVSSRPAAFVVLAAVTVGTVMRLVQAVTEPAYLHPDALFQALEPAFSLVWGYGIETWEFREGMRSWVWPGLLA